MSERLIKHWGANAAVTFGASGVKGDRGEHFAAQFLRSYGYTVEFHDSYEKQVSGFDITFRKPTDEMLFGADVKNNLTADGTFFVECEETGWLLNKKKLSRLIMHVNPDTGWCYWYRRSRMIRYVTDNGHIGKKFIPIRKYTKGLDWIEKKRVDL